MEAIEPSEFDLVVIGTGLPESVLAGAAAKAGRSVLQLDPSDAYGGSWASLRLHELQGLLAGGDNVEQPDEERAPAAAAGLRNAEVWRRPGADLGPDRQYSLDLAPKVAYGAGPLIELLLGSGAHNYLEFKLVQGSYLLDRAASSSDDVGAAQPQLRSVPSSRSEVFKDRQLSPVQKRSLMRFLKAAAEALDGKGPLKDAFGVQPIEQLLQQQGLDHQLQQFLLHGLLLADSSGFGDAANCQHVSAADALDRLRLFVQSAGRYGPGTGPFLTPLYGCGELPQAFSRVAAVAGAVQVLRCGIAGLSFDEHTFSCDAVELASGQIIRCQQLAANQTAMGEWLATFHPPTRTCSTHRCCAVLDGLLVPGEQHTMVTLLPSAAGGAIVRALAVSSSTAVCPPGKQLLYVWAPAAGPGSGMAQQPTAAEALMPALEALADTSGLQRQAAGAGTGGGADTVAPASTADAAAAEAADAAAAETRTAASRPAVLWAAFYTQDCLELTLADAGSSSGWPANVVLCPGPDGTATFATAVQAAKRCYWRLYPAADGAPAAFPLDPGQPSAADAGEDGQEDGAAQAAGAAEVDSDDEAVAALQAALRGVSTGHGADAQEAEEAQEPAT